MDASVQLSAHVDTAIVGAGHAGVECAWALRAAGLEGPIAIFGAELHPPYERPPLSKALLTGATSADRIVLRAPAAYEKLQVQFNSGDPVAAIDAASNTLRTQSGVIVHYRHCVLATGATARTLPELSGDRVFSVRNLDDSQALRDALHPGVRLLVVGAGYLGLEAACSASKLGAQVIVLEQGGEVMSGKVSKHTAAQISSLHQEAGIVLQQGARIIRWEQTATGWRAQLADGSVHEADLVLVSIGAIPDTRLAEAAGLECQDGVIVDENCRSSVTNIYAIGDCASAFRSELQRHARIESVQNALTQARLAAAAIAGKNANAARPPTFWSEQHGRRLQMAGLVHPDYPSRDRLIPTLKGWLVERYQEGKLAGIEAVDSPVEFMKGVARIGTAEPTT